MYSLSHATILQCRILLFSYFLFFTSRDSLARENPTVSFFHVSPGILSLPPSFFSPIPPHLPFSPPSLSPSGFVNTNWGTEMPWYIRFAVRAIQPLGRFVAVVLLLFLIVVALVVIHFFSLYRSPSQVGNIFSNALLNPPVNKEKTKTDLPNFYLLDQVCCYSCCCCGGSVI